MQGREGRIPVQQGTSEHMMRAALEREAAKRQWHTSMNVTVGLVEDEKGEETREERDEEAKCERDQGTARGKGGTLTCRSE